MRTTLWGGVAAVALLGASLATVPAASAVVTKGDGDGCVTRGASSAKVAEGGRLNAEPTRLTAKQVAAFERQTTRRMERKYGSAGAAQRLKRTPIDTHVHVITKRNGSGNTKRAAINRQLNVINRAFAGKSARASIDTPFRFRLRSVDRTHNTDWYNWKFNDDDRPAKRALHRGGFDDLNIYVTDLGDSLLGYAFFPGLARKNLFRDGLVVHKESLPGGSFEQYDRGDTATHEIGHYLGLYHTFQGSCGPNGDFVSDTPRQLADDNVFKCDESLNTCGNNPGQHALRDPVHNFMNYTSDRCIDRFTRGQEDRMELSWRAYRADG